MATAVGIIGIVFAVAGLAFAAFPGAGQYFVQFFTNPSRIYLVYLGLGIRLLLGIFFIYGSRFCRPEFYSQGIVLGIGVVMVTMAFLFGLLGPSRILAVVNWLVARLAILRSAGIAVMVLGGYLVYASGAFC